MKKLAHGLYGSWWNVVLTVAAAAGFFFVLVFLYTRFAPIGGYSFVVVNAYIVSVSIIFVALGLVWVVLADRRKKASAIVLSSWVLLFAAFSLLAPFYGSFLNSKKQGFVHDEFMAACHASVDESDLDRRMGELQGLVNQKKISVYKGGDYGLSRIERISPLPAIFAKGDFSNLYVNVAAKTIPYACFWDKAGNEPRHAVAGRSDNFGKGSNGFVPEVNAESILAFAVSGGVASVQKNEPLVKTDVSPNAHEVTYLGSADSVSIESRAGHEGNKQTVSLEFARWEEGQRGVFLLRNGVPVTLDFNPDRAYFVARTSDFLLVKFRDKRNLPPKCEAAYRWVTVTAPNRLLLSEAFGSCTTSPKTRVRWDKGRLQTIVSGGEGRVSTFQVTAFALAESRWAERPRVTTLSGPSVAISLPPEKLYSAEKLEKALEDSREERQRREQQRQAVIVDGQQPGRPTGELEEGNFFDMLALPKVRESIRQSTDGPKVLAALDTQLETVSKLPSIIERNGIVTAGTCGQEGCENLKAVLLFDKSTGTTGGFIASGFNILPFGEFDYFDTSAKTAGTEEMLGILVDE